MTGFSGIGHGFAVDKDIRAEEIGIIFGAADVMDIAGIQAHIRAVIEGCRAAAALINLRTGDRLEQPMAQMPRMPQP